MSILENLPHRCTIQRRKRGPGQTSALGGNLDVAVVEQTGVECWVQQASDGEVRDYAKRDMSISQKIYFTSDPGVTTRHQILITSLDRGVTTISNPSALDVMSRPKPDASAGLGVVFRVMVSENTGERP